MKSVGDERAMFYGWREWDDDDDGMGIGNWELGIGIWPPSLEGGGQDLTCSHHIPSFFFLTDYFIITVTMYSPLLSPLLSDYENSNFRSPRFSLRLYHETGDPLPISPPSPPTDQEYHRCFLIKSFHRFE